MVGILLALQVNNWNENRKSLQIEKGRYSKMIIDLRKDSTTLEKYLYDATDHQNIHYQSEQYQIPVFTGMTVRIYP